MTTRQFPHLPTTARRVWCAMLICAAFAIALTAQTAKAAPPLDPPTAGKALAEVAHVNSEDWDYIENEYIGVTVNHRGQFVIYTTGGDPEVEGDENKWLMYPGPTSFTTFRWRLDDFPGWSYYATHEERLQTEQKVYRSCDESQRDYRCYIETSYHLVCHLWARQRLSFMDNTFTGRKDMVRITYSFVKRRAELECTDMWLYDTHLGVRLMVDTLIGDNDYAPFFVSGVGYTDTVSTFSGQAVPPFFRVFEDPEYASGSLQSIGYLHPSGRAPSRFQIASWRDIVQTDWGYDTASGSPHEDSAVAVYWTPDKVFAGATGDLRIRLNMGYGLAPQGGGDTWTDAPATLSEGATFDAFTWVVNNTDQPYTNGVAQLSLPQGISALPQAQSGTDASLTQEIGDLPPHQTAQVTWPLEITGGSGRYIYTTTVNFASGQTFVDVQEITLHQGVQFAETHYDVDKRAGNVTVTVARANLDGNPLAVRYATLDDSAIAGEDYVAAEGVLEFAAEQNEATFTVDILDDGMEAANRAFLLTLSIEEAHTDLTQVVDQGPVYVTIIDVETDPPATPEPVVTPLPNTPSMALYLPQAQNDLLTNAPSPTNTPVPTGSPTIPAIPEPPPNPLAPTHTPVPAPSELTVDMRNKQSVKDFFETYHDTAFPPMEWSGDYSTCNAGTTSSQYRQSLQNLVNYFRAMAGVPANVTFLDEYNAKAQQAALMMSVNRQLDHYPTQDWQCYTAAGAEGAGSSNLSLYGSESPMCTVCKHDYCYYCNGASCWDDLGAHWDDFGDSCWSEYSWDGWDGWDDIEISPHGIKSQMRDDGEDNYPVGHRRWILCPATKHMGTGDMPSEGGAYETVMYPSANALWVHDLTTFNSARPPARDDFVAWPPRGYVPYPVVYDRWSFMFADADFSAASVIVRYRGGTLDVHIEPRGGELYCENTLVWVPSINWSQLDRIQDHTFQVEISGVKIQGEERSFAYEVIVFFPVDGSR